MESNKYTLTIRKDSYLRDMLYLKLYREDKLVGELLDGENYEGIKFNSLKIIEGIQIGLNIANKAEEIHSFEVKFLSDELKDILDVYTVHNRQGHYFRIDRK